MKSVLQKVGFSEEEAKIYLALLELGEGNLKEISIVSGIPRTSLYGYIGRLIDDGTVQQYMKRGKKVYIPLSPSELINITEKNTAFLKDSAHRLSQLAGAYPSKPKITYYEGSAGIKRIFKAILDEKRPFLAITSIDAMNDIVEYSFDEFINQRIKQHLPVKLITTRSSAALRLRETDDAQYRTTRFIPHEYNFQTANYIFGDKVAIISLKHSRALGTIIQDKAIAHTNQVYFDLIWKMASSQ